MTKRHCAEVSPLPCVKTATFRKDTAFMIGTLPKLNRCLFPNGGLPNGSSVRFRHSAKPGQCSEMAQCRTGTDGRLPFVPVIRMQSPHSARFAHIPAPEPDQCRTGKIRTVPKLPMGPKLTALCGQFRFDVCRGRGRPISGALVAATGMGDPRALPRNRHRG